MSQPSHPLPIRRRLTPRYDRVVLICPTSVTGGPEAMHQLSDAIIGHGGDAVMAYFGQDCSLALAGDAIRCSYAGNPASPAYGAYRSVHAAEIPLTPRSLVIFPEIAFGAALQPRPFQRAVWWLSVDNALPHMPLLADAAQRRAVFAPGGLIHFYQSDYAREFLAEAGAGHALPLGDYLNAAYLDGNPGIAKDRSAAYFPRKGRDLAEAFFNRHPDLLRRPLEGMSREGVRLALSASSVYIDFGNHPGKDRTPREAALCGNVVFLHERGAARFHLDHPLEPFFLFSTQDASDGSLHARVTEALAAADDSFARQSTYRSRIAFERDEFNWQVTSWFFDPGLTRAGRARPAPGSSP